MHGQEITGEIELFDQVELVFDAFADIGRNAGEVGWNLGPAVLRLEGRVAVSAIFRIGTCKLFGRACPGQLRETRLRRHAGGYGNFGVFVLQLVEAEAAALSDFDTRRQRAFMAAKQPRHFRGRL